MPATSNAVETVKSKLEELEVAEQAVKSLKAEIAELKGLFSRKPRRAKKKTGEPKVVAPSKRKGLPKTGKKTEAPESAPAEG